MTSLAPAPYHKLVKKLTGAFEIFKGEIIEETLATMQSICDETENEGGRQLIEYYRKNHE